MFSFTSSQIAVMLLEGGANPDAKDHYEATAMHREAWKATVLGVAKRVGHDLVTKNRNHHIKAYKVRNGVSSFHSTHPPQWKSILKVRFIYV